MNQIIKTIVANGYVIQKLINITSGTKMVRTLEFKKKIEKCSREFYLLLRITYKTIIHYCSFSFVEFNRDSQ